MGLFGPIWESRNTDKIRKRIARTADDSLLANIALRCADPELRQSAARRIRNPGIRERTMLQACKNGDTETAVILLGSGYEMLDAAVRSGDPALLSVLALRTRNLGEWVKEFDALLTEPGYEAAAAHYQELKQAADEEKRAIARQKRKEAEEKRRDALIRDPVRTLTAASGKASEKKLWKEWYDHQLSLPQNNLLYTIANSMQSLPWYRYFPAGALEKIALYAAKPYGGEGQFHTSGAESDTLYLLQTLYDTREDLRDEIPRLDGAWFYSGDRASAVNFGDHHEDWLVTFDAVPAYRLSVSVSQDRCGVRLTESPWIPENECLSSGGHILDGRCACFRCGAIAHDWEITKSRASVLKVCKRCGYRTGTQDYAD